MLFFRLLPSPLVGRQPQQVEEMASRHSFVKAKGANASFTRPFDRIMNILDFFFFSAAEVSIQLKNKGDEAYRHKEFGDSIIITRKFTMEGSSSWKIKSKDGKIVSTKRDELSKICDHMNIQVDNPMTVLTQGRPFPSFQHPYFLAYDFARRVTSVFGLVQSDGKIQCECFHSLLTHRLMPSLVILEGYPAPTTFGRVQHHSGEHSIDISSPRPKERSNS